jgi:hypothetical protein
LRYFLPLLYAYALVSPKRASKGIAVQMAKKTSRKKSLRPHVAAVASTDSSGAASLTSLNFKVAHEFHREFKTFAAQHGKKMVEVLQEAFASLKGKYGG